MNGKAYSGSTVAFGEYGLKALEPGWVSSAQIESARIAITRHAKRGRKVWIRVFPDKPITKKPAETRMGKGKGNPEYWVAVVKPGRILYEMCWSYGNNRKRSYAACCSSTPHCYKVYQERRGGFVKPSELKALTIDELNQKEQDMRKELFNLRFQSVTGEIENPMRIQAVRRDIARVLTMKTEKGKART